MLRRVAVVAGVGVLVLLGYAIKLIAFPAPEATVQRYFQALQARNLGDAANELFDGYSLADGNRWATMSSVMANEHYRPPTDVRMGGWVRGAPGDGAERVVAVQYDLAGTTYSSLLKLSKPDGVWRIVNGTGTIESGSRNTLVNGQNLAEQKNPPLFPGVYEVMLARPFTLMSAQPLAVAVTPGQASTARLATTLLPEAATNVKRYLDVIVKACETTLGVQQNDCPFKGVDTTGMTQVQWRLVRMPELTVEQAGPDSVTVKGIGPGSVRLLAIAGGVGIDRVDSFSLHGTCVEANASVSCRFTA